ncbi:hypothetical protein QEM14_003437 [Pseudomonas putida]|nr:hypothetical protein [Pseudomonas putida]
MESWTDITLIVCERSDTKSICALSVFGFSVSATRNKLDKFPRRIYFDGLGVSQSFFRAVMFSQYNVDIQMVARKLLVNDASLSSKFLPIFYNWPVTAHRSYSNLARIQLIDFQIALRRSVLFYNSCVNSEASPKENR